LHNPRAGPKNFFCPSRERRRSAYVSCGLIGGGP
jgi:hypothetical protein